MPRPARALAYTARVTIIPKKRTVPLVVLLAAVLVAAGALLEEPGQLRVPVGVGLLVLLAPDEADRVLDVGG